MKIKYIIFISVSFITTFIYCHTNQEDFPIIKGPYLGQKPPGIIPVLFSKDIISPHCAVHGCPVFMPSGKEIYWAPMESNLCKDKTDEILFMKLKDSIWTEPEVVSFSSTFFDSDDPCMAPDGKRIYFNTHRPSGLLSFDFSEKIMYVERVGDEWSSPNTVGGEINSMFEHWQVSVNKNYDLYFHAEKNVSKAGIYVSRYENGQYQTPQMLPPEINSSNAKMPYISPDDSYLVFARQTQKNNLDLFISYKDSKGNWKEAQNLGTDINSPYNDLCPNVTPDGKFLFFLSQRDGESYAYWVSTKIIEELKRNK